MTTEEALDFLRRNSPLPPDQELTDELAFQYDEVRKFFLRNPDPRSIPLLLNSYGDGSGFGMYQLIEDVIAQFSKEEVLPHLRSAIESPHDAVRFWSIQMAPTFIDESLVGPLLLNLEHPSPFVRSAAADALSFVNEQFVRDALHQRNRIETDPTAQLAIQSALADLSRRSR